MWDPPRPGIEPMSFALAGGFLTTGPPGKSLDTIFIHSHTCVCMAESHCSPHKAITTLLIDYSPQKRWEFISILLPRFNYAWSHHWVWSWECEWRCSVPCLSTDASEATRVLHIPSFPLLWHQPCPDIGISLTLAQVLAWKVVGSLLTHDRCEQEWEIHFLLL